MDFENIIEEIDIHKRMNFKHIIKFIDFFEEDNKIYILM